VWPYAGHDRWTRLDIRLALAVVPLAAAALAFWPPRPAALTRQRYAVKRLAAPALLVTLYVVGGIDSDWGSTTLWGAALLLCLIGWLWLPSVRRGQVGPALAWVLAAGALAAVLASPLGNGQAWLDYRSWDLFPTQPSRTAFSWDQTYGPIPWSRSQAVMFTVRAPNAQLWKVTTLDRFDGLRFVRSGIEAPGVGDLLLPLNDQWYQFARFTIRAVSSPLLPSEQGTTTAVTVRDPVRYEEDGTVRTAGPGLRSGDSYTVMAYVPEPTATELRAAPSRFPAAYLRYTDFDLPTPSQSGLGLAATDPPQPGRFFTHRTVGAPAPGLNAGVAPPARRRILASPYGRIYALARRLARGRRSPYDVVLAVEAYLKTNYVYTEQSPRRRYPLDAFLFRDGAGYCQQFSGAMALMLRMDGIPTRVAVGFRPGSRDASDAYEVRAVDAHSWVEVFFAGIGWVSFDPTPPRSTNPIPPSLLFTSENARSPLEAIAATVGGIPRPVSRDRVPRARHRVSRKSDDAGRLVLIAFGLLGLVLAVAAVIGWLAGGVRLRRSLDEDGELAAAELVAAVRRLGYRVPATVTLAQIERLVRLHGGPDAARYVQLLRERRYGGGRGAPPTLGQRRRLRRGLTGHLGLEGRLRGQWVLPPGTIAWGTRPAVYGAPAGGP
jgi:transglutaminase-like putative cysteine protease